MVKGYTSGNGAEGRLRRIWGRRWGWAWGYPRQGNGVGLGIKREGFPEVVLFLEAEALMEAAWAGFPEFEIERGEAVAAPMGGAWDGFLCVEELGLGEAEEEGLSVGEGLALEGGPGALLGEPWAGGEIGLGLRIGDGGEGPLNAYLLGEGGPPEAHGGMGVMGQLFAFGGEGVGEEDEACFVKVFEQQHAGVGFLGIVHGSEDKSVVVFGICELGLGEEGGEEGEGGGEWGEGHGGGEIVENGGEKQEAMQKRVSSFARMS